jgi:FAD/FMN-containing dehydrogenase
MGKFNTNYTTYLEEQFGDRVTFNKTERKLYSHDVGDLPNLVKKLVGETTADAVVQPETEDEIVKLVKWARENRVPITPRGKATSGYGGVVPLKKGIVIDFYRMNKLLNIDREKLTATVQAGMVWERLDSALGMQGLTLKL